MVVVSMFLLFGREVGGGGHVFYVWGYFFFLLFGRGETFLGGLSGRRFLVFAVGPGNGSSLIYRAVWLGVDGL